MRVGLFLVPCLIFLSSETPLPRQSVYLASAAVQVGLGRVVSRHLIRFDFAHEGERIREVSDGMGRDETAG